MEMEMVKNRDGQSDLVGTLLIESSKSNADFERRGMGVRAPPVTSAVI